MISPKKMMKMAKKWQREAATWSKIISLTIVSAALDFEANIHGCVNSSVSQKGHFVICTTDQERFDIPLVYLDNNVFREMLKMSEDEFGLPRDGPIKLPCDAVFLKYIVEIIQRGVTEDLERALLMSMATSPCSLSSSHQGESGNPPLVCGY